MVADTTVSNSTEVLVRYGRILEMYVFMTLYWFSLIVCLI